MSERVSSFAHSVMQKIPVIHFLSVKLAFSLPFPNICCKKKVSRQDTESSIIISTTIVDTVTNYTLNKWIQFLHLKKNSKETKS